MIDRLSKSRLPLSILSFLLFTDFLAWLGYLPSKLESFSFLATWLAENGVVFVFLLALVENLALINVYFPGSIAILAAMAGAIGSWYLVFSVWLAVTAGSVLGLSITFLFATRILDRKKIASNLDESDQFIARHWIVMALTSFWHPHVASLTCILLAQKKASYWLFLRISLLGNVVWNTFWTAVVLTLGNVFAEGIGGLMLIYAYLAIWAVVSFVRGS